MDLYDGMTDASDNCPLAKPAKTGTSYYDTLQEAYDNASTVDIIQVQYLMFIGDVAVDQNKTVSIQGGYDCGYSTIIGTTIINGDMTISNGKVTIENVQVQ